MNKMLIVNAHPLVDAADSFTLRAFRHFLRVYKELNPAESIEQINLYDADIPIVDRAFLEARGKLAEGTVLTEMEQNIVDRTSALLKQFKEAKKYVIVMPLHNFNIPSKLKDYFDNVFLPRETYKFTENGSVGLLKDGRSILVIQGSGSIYTNNDWYTEVEYSHKYLQAMFHFLGVEDYRILRVQGTAIRHPDKVLEEAFREAEDAAKQMSLKGAPV